MAQINGYQISARSTEHGERVGTYTESETLAGAIERANVEFPEGQFFDLQAEEIAARLTREDIIDGWKKDKKAKTK